MLSDGTVVALPLRRLGCRRCGLGWLDPAIRTRLPRRLFGPRYRLYSHPPTDDERARARLYAAWLSDLVSTAAPRSLVDVGCGNGALLAALAARWPATRGRGIEPVAAAAAAGRAAGVAVTTAAFEAPQARLAADLVVAVNVIEHLDAPRALLARAARELPPAGRLLVVAPDAGAPWHELLMIDHLWNFTATSLAMLAGAAGLRVLASAPAPAAIGAFRGYLLARGAPRAVSAGGGDAGATIARARRRYMARWRRLDAALAARLPPERRIVAFGVGEAASLLRAYAPTAWGRVAGVTADQPGGALDDLAFAPLEGLDGTTTTVLLAVRPAAQDAVAERLRRRGLPTVTWSDLDGG
jgi:SAM-dependent methyltransferase